MSLFSSVGQFEESIHPSRLSPCYHTGSMRSRGLAEPIGVVLAAFLLACLLTYPIAAQLGSVGRVDNNDGRWSIWVVSWVAHSLTTDPLNTYHANIFYPHDNALTFSEANLV